MKLRLCVAMFLSAAIAVSTGTTASATLFFSDGFDYPNGNLTVYDGAGDDVSGGLWVPHSGTGFPTSIDVANGQAVLKQGNPASEDANRLAQTGNPGFTIGLGETWYYSALVTVNDEREDPSSTPLFNEYFMHFKDAGNNFRGRAYVGDPSTGTGGEGFRFGISTSSGGQVATTDDLLFGTQYAIVVSYTVSPTAPPDLSAPGGTSRMWVNPVNESSPSIVDFNVPAGGTAVNSVALRQAFNSGLAANYEVLVDVVALASTFDDALAALIPEPSSAALALLGCVGMFIRPRR